jgi:aspartate kinase
MKNRLVMKFGGTSLLTPERIKNAAQIVATAAAEGNEIVVVVSAMGHTTDELIKLSSEITTEPDRREMDGLMATGEQVSANLMAMALQARGCKARSLNGVQARIITDAKFGDAKIDSLNFRVLSSCFNDGCIPVITGFQGVTITGDVTTLGRGGSDTTAIALAATIQAERCDIYSDVDGIYSADPRIVANAAKLDCLSVSEMLELAKSGAQVLNARAVEMARERGVSVRVRSTFKPEDQGTLVNGNVHKARNFTGLALNTSIDCIEIELEKLEMGPDRDLDKFRLRRFETRRQILQTLTDAGIDAEIVSRVHPNPYRILLLLRKTDTADALAALRKGALAFREIKVNSDWASIVLVATAITNQHEIDAMAAMNKNNIPVTAIGSGLQRLTLLLPLSFSLEAANILHHQLGQNHSASDACFDAAANGSGDVCFDAAADGSGDGSGDGCFDAAPNSSGDGRLANVRNILSGQTDVQNTVNSLWAK